MSIREIRQYGGFGTLSADSGIRATANSMQIHLGHGQVREVKIPDLTQPGQGGCTNLPESIRDLDLIW
jgi:hypothetical protein